MTLKLLNGDCLKLLPTIPDKSIDLILCDLPYGTTACKWDIIIPFEPLWKEYNRIIKDNGVVVLFATQPFTTKLIASNFKNFRYCWYWKKNNKTGGTFSKIQPMRCIEDICVFYRQKPTYNPQGLIKLKNPIYNKKRTCDIYSYRSTGSVQRYKNYPCHFLEYSGCGYGAEKRVHPTQKPLKLLEYLIKTYTDEDDTVLDNCMGSGSTGVACINTGRKFIGIEKDNHYFKIASSRIAEAFNMPTNK